MPQYNFDLVDDKDPNVTHKVVVDERVNLLEALANQGVCKNKAGIRLYNQKYYTTRFDENLPFANKLLYLKKVIIFWFRKKEEHVFVLQNNSSWLELLILN